MPKQLLEIRKGITWISACIRPCDTGMQTELSFQRDGKLFTITFNEIPEPSFFRDLYTLSCVTIYEYSSRERGWLEGGRYVISLNEDDEGIGVSRIACSQVRWDPAPS